MTADALNLRACWERDCTRCGEPLPLRRAIGPGALICESCEGELDPPERYETDDEAHAVAHGPGRLG